MTLDSAKSGVFNHPKNLQHSPDFRPPACTPLSPQWPGFYRQPIECDIIDGTGWIDFLWAVLHRTDPPLYRASGCFDSTSRQLGLHLTLHHQCILSPIQFLTKSHVRTKTLHAIYDILEYRGYLESVFPGLISDILQEIKDNGSDTVEFSVDLRQRCKTAVPELEYKMSMLQAVVIRQHRDFNPKKLAKTITCLYFGGIAIVFLVFALLYPWNPIESTFDSCLVDIGIFCAFTVRITSGLQPHASDIVHDVDVLNTSTFELIWAVRDVAGLLTCIAESPLSDVLHAEQFLKAFQASFLGGREELSKLRSWLQGLPSWTDKNFVAHYWNDRDVA
ncbi:uncharacterized protein ARMOST_14555 [Armillaria ostoyae]|uniref:Uncharacterized protein n=1 Tax=Armillaria ostoyae TaxID=47428 RepID=A0A284RQU6_ARMOS|nr:uncharacterized protein ARMOST_14555 [Armillaria ostoyae]